MPENNPHTLFRMDFARTSATTHRTCALFSTYTVIRTNIVIRTYTVIRFQDFFLPTLLLGPTRLLNFIIFSHQHCYSDSTVIRHPRVIFEPRPPNFENQYNF